MKGPFQVCPVRAFNCITLQLYVCTALFVSLLAAVVYNGDII